MYGSVVGSAEWADLGLVYQDQSTIEQSENTHWDCVAYYWRRVKKCGKCSLNSSKKSLIHKL